MLQPVKLNSKLTIYGNLWQTIKGVHISEPLVAILDFVGAAALQTTWQCSVAGGAALHVVRRCRIVGAAAFITNLNNEKWMEKYLDKIINIGWYSYCWALKSTKTVSTFNFWISRLPRRLKIPSWTFFNSPFRVDSKNIHFVIIWWNFDRDIAKILQGSHFRYYHFCLLLNQELDY